MSVWDNPYISKKGKFSDSVTSPRSTTTATIASSRFLESAVGQVDYERLKLRCKRFKPETEAQWESIARMEERHD